MRGAGVRLLTPALLLSLGCGNGAGPEPEVIDRETFVATYVDLRAAALSTADGRITPERREEILRAHGVTEEDLLAFAEVHGRDVEYMAEVWSEIEQRLDLRTAPGDTASRTSG